MKFNLVLACVLVVVSAQEYDYITEATKLLSLKIDDFSKILYQNVVKKERVDNLVTSPLSANVVLSMLSYGAEGPTLERLTRYLNLPPDRSLTLRAYWNLIRSCNLSESKVILELASKVMLSKELAVHSTFLNLSRHIFNSEAAVFDPLRPQESIRDVNHWVESKTHRNIQNVLNPGDINPQSRLVLLNAVYFKANWAFPINPRGTVDRNFNLNETYQIKVPTMFLMGSFVSAELTEFDADFCAIPYEDEKFNMILIVPKRIDGLEDIEKNLSLINVTRLMSHTRNTIQLYLPKFRVQSTLDLKKPLKYMGFDEFFENTVYTHISQEPLQVDKIIQKSFIEVNEKGSEAGSSTVLTMNRTFSNRVAVDRPSLFLIVKDNNILFIGRIVDPSA